MGVGAVKETGNQVRTLGCKKPLIVTDKGLSALGVADKIKGYVEEAGAQAVIFDGAEPNPTDINVHDGLKIFQEEKCDSIISWAAEAPTTVPRVSVSLPPTAATSVITRESTSPANQCLRSSPSTPLPVLPVK